MFYMGVSSEKFIHSKHNIYDFVFLHEKAMSYKLMHVCKNGLFVAIATRA